jgi:hypothetical protein
MRETMARLSKTEKYRARQKAWLEQPQNMVAMRLRNRINTALTRGAHTRAGRTNELLGCSYQEFARHLESQFEPGMSWENRHQWHIDHIRPCASFDLTDPEQQRRCFHWSNMQPLWAEDNLRKHAKWNDGAA